MQEESKENNKMSEEDNEEGNVTIELNEAGIRNKINNEGNPYPKSNLYL